MGRFHISSGILEVSGLINGLMVSKTHAGEYRSSHDQAAAEATAMCKCVADRWERKRSRIGLWKEKELDTNDGEE